MAHEPICNRVYQIGNTETISLPVHLPGLPETVNIEGYTLKRRPEFHVSLVCTGQIRERHAVNNTDFTKWVVKDFCSYVERHAIVFVRFTGEFRFVSRGGEKSLVAMADVANVEGFFDYMNEVYSLAMEYPPTHVTLYTLDGEPGIFLIDSNDIKERTKVVPNPGLTLP